MSRTTVILDSTQISDHYQCPMMWNLIWNENLTLHPTIDDPITAGTYGHKLLEIYYGNIQKLGITGAVQLALSFNPTDHGNKYPLTEEKIKLVKDRFNTYWQTYCTNDIVPMYKQKYVIRIRENGLPYDDTESVPLVEQGFSYCLLDTSEYLFVLEGKIDLIGILPGQLCFVDHKFQFRERNLLKRRIQFKNYALATGLTCGIANYIRLTKEVKSTTFSRDVLLFSAQDLRYWKEELIHKFIEVAKQKQLGIYPHNWDSCEGKFGYPCDFATDDRNGRPGICDNAHNPQLVNHIKQNNYVKREDWKPW